MSVRSLDEDVSTPGGAREEVEHAPEKDPKRDTRQRVRRRSYGQIRRDPAGHRTPR